MNPHKKTPACSVNDKLSPPIQESQMCTMRKRFRGFLPVVVDVETGGVDHTINPLLEVCIVLLKMDAQGLLVPDAYYFEHILPFKDAVLNHESLAFNKIDPYQPLRFALEEKAALKKLFLLIKAALKDTGCHRAVLVGHNAWFDLLFLKAAAARSHLAFPFHAFTSFDTATLSGLCYGQTVLAKALRAAQIAFDPDEAHSAIYDARKTAELFCKITNQVRL